MCFKDGVNKKEMYSYFWNVKNSLIIVFKYLGIFFYMEKSKGKLIILKYKVR